MKNAALPLLLAALLLSLPLPVQSQQQGGAPQPTVILPQDGTGSQIQVQPLGTGFVLQGSQTQQQGEAATQQQGGTAIPQQQGETAAQQQESGVEQPSEATAAETGPPREAEGVSLEGLDKITARTFAFEAPLNETVRFGYLEVTARRCVVAAEEETPERSAFLEVVEAKPGRNPSKVFSGWMFASSPSVSAMEHAVYDIWVVDCMGYQGEVAHESTPAAEVVPEDVEAPVEGVERPLD
jgi:hypothetical protein